MVKKDRQAREQGVDLLRPRTALERFRLGNLLLAIASKPLLAIPVLALLAGLLEVIRQVGMTGFGWISVIVWGSCGAAVGALFAINAHLKSHPVFAATASALMMGVVTAIIGLSLAWPTESSIVLVAAGAVAGATAQYWMRYLSLL